MKRIISIILAVLLLCTPAFASFELPELPDHLFDNAQLKEKTQQVIEKMRSFTDEIKSMSDEELEQKVREVAAEYNIPEMNQEQMDFIVKVCRSFETVEQFGETVKEYEEKANNFGSAISSLLETLSGLVEQLTNVLDGLNGLLEKFGGSEETA